MKIALVSEHASPLAVLGGVDAGGQNVHVSALALALAELGHAVVVYTRRDDPELPDRVVLGPGVVVEHLPAGPPVPVGKDDLLPHLPALTVSLTRRLAVTRPDVVHTHFWMSGVAGLGAANVLGLPVVHTFHALGATKKRWQGAQDTSPAGRVAAERGILRDADRVIATCTDELRELRALGGQPDRVDVVPCGVDLGHFTPDGPAPARTALRRLLVVSRLVPRKGIADAVTALAGLPDCEIVVAGGPQGPALDQDPEALRLRTLARSLGVADRLTLLGGVGRDQLPALMRSADLLLCLPLYEPFGIVPLEAMACGLPVIGTAVGGLLDTVAADETGLLVPPSEPALAAAAVRALLADEPRRLAMGRAGVSRARRLFSWSRVAAESERSYLRAIRESASRQEPAGRSLRIRVAR